MTLDILLSPITFLDPTIPAVALICAIYTRKFIWVWPITVLAAFLLPIALLLINKQYIEIFKNTDLQETFNQVIIIRIVIASFWTLLCWWGANRIRDYLAKEYHEPTH